MQEKVKRLANIKLLIVEDEESLLKILSETLTKLGADFLTAQNGKEGLETYKNNPDIKLIVTDINLPKMSGLEMMSEIRKTDEQIKFIVMTAHTEKEYSERAQELNVSNYILKPFDFIKFINAVDELNIK